MTTATSSLAAHTTLRLGGPAERMVRATCTTEVVDAIRAADADGEPVLLLGGGSNVVIADDGVPGLTLLVESTGRRIERDADGVLLSCEAGADWDEVVAECVADGLGGLECLSGIPGRVGAVPVQNVGAYGVEIASLLRDVDLYDRRAGVVQEHVPAADLRLGYRTSALKGSTDRVVLRARFAVPADGLSAPIRYTELATALGVRPDDRVPTATARDAVLALRRGKGMVLDPSDHDTWSAGSFFTNPVLPDERIAALDLDDAPRWPAGAGSTKLSAAWLIQRSGFHKGYRGPGGRVALSSKHTLALTNRGGASTADLLALARQLRDGVLATFGIELHAEPVFVGCAM